MKLCASCAEPISAKRLAALPNATLCIECASSNEAQLIPACRNMERLGNVLMKTDDSYEPRRPMWTRFVTGGISQAVELGI